jgi:hypothetical protein
MMGLHFVGGTKIEVAMVVSPLVLAPGVTAHLAKSRENKHGLGVI